LRRRSIHTTRRFDSETLAALHHGKTLRVKAGDRPHRFINIWVVVVDDRVFVRSWSIKARGWYRTLLKEPRGFIQIARRTIPVRARQVRSERLRSAIDRAYLEKYDAPGSLPYAQDLGRANSRATTTELVPGGGAHRGGAAS